ncbi:hypothetical protein NE237_022617 [Protea cynaroides]|uniref:Uncharacterized protein n=1 Tax=Protea cynaroides TaxID=273540 RepID=A0A9Q0HDC4_9MAGN|nr:hypothetical protein NE237_022617 [Protea cynaroides]
MLCLRPSTKEDCLPKWDNSVVPFPGVEKKGTDEEPTSPRVGCMGQIIKRESKVVGFPIHLARCNNSSNSDQKKYFKLNKVFSSKNLNSFLLVRNLNTTTTINSKSRQMMIKGSSKIKTFDEMDYVSICLDDLDPPLPVVKPTPRVSTDDGGDAVSLWKRRRGGDQILKTLQLQQRNPSCVLGPNTL